MESYYDLLEVAPTASADEIKRAFRAQIARYHPDKVQHLGREFQAMAADRAAELTEAYRVLSDAARREEYDRQLEEGAAPAPRRRATPPTESPTKAAASRPAAPAEPQPTSGTAGRPLSREQDAFVRRVVVGKVRQAMATVLGSFEEPPVRGFDLAAVPRTGLFARSRGPRLLGRFVPCVDKDAVTETWTWAGRWNVPRRDEICVILMGSSMAPAGELADAIARQRRLSPNGPKVTLIPVDARDWQAHMPIDAPPQAKELLAVLRQGG